MKNPGNLFGTICLGGMALLLSGCDEKDKPTANVRDSAIVTVTPSTLETGSRSEIAIVGSGTAFGDSLWLEKGGSKIPGGKLAGGTDTSLIAYMEIPNDAATGKWDLVVQGKADHGGARLNAGVSIVPSLARITKVEPSIITAYGDESLEITCEGAGLAHSRVSVRLTSGTDTLPISVVDILSDSELRIMAAFSGKRKWDLEITTTSRRLLAKGAVESLLETPFLGSLSPEEAERDMDVAITVSGVHTRFLQGTRTAWLKNGSDSIAAEGRAPFNPTVATEPVSDTVLKAYFRIPADAKAGLWDLNVRQPWYSLSLPKAFNVLEPTVAAVKSISPAWGRPGESLALSVTGHRVQFAQGTASHVIIDLVRGTDTVYSASAGFRTVSQSTATTAPALIPSNAPIGFLDVHARYFIPEGQIAGNPVGRWVIIKPLRDGFSIQPPATSSGYIGSVVPMTLETSSRTTVSIQGRNTHFGDSVWLERGSLQVPGSIQGPAAETALTVVFDLPADLATGKWNLVVAQKSGGENLVWVGLSILSSTASITGIEPNTLSSFVPQTLKVTAKGIDFRQEPLAFRFFQSDGSRISIAGFTVIDDSEVELYLHPVDGMKRGKWNLRVDAGSKTVILPGAITLAMPVPELVAVAPVSGEPELQMALTLTGVNTLFRQGSQAVWLTKGNDTVHTSGETSLHPFIQSEAHTDTEMAAYFALPADADTGYWDVHVRQDWYTLSKLRAFHIGEPTAPAVASVTPASGRRGDAVGISISGHRTDFEQGTATHVKMMLVKDGDTLAALDSYRTFFGLPAQQEFEIPSKAPLGSYDVHANYDRGGTSVTLKPLKNGFTVFDFLPGTVKITQVTPSMIEAGSRVALEVSGVNTEFGNSIQLRKAGAPAIPGVITGAVTDTLLTAEFDAPLDAEGYDWYVVLSQKDGKPELWSSKPITIVPTTAEIIGVAPSTLIKGSTTTVTAKCRNFDLTHGPVTVRIWSGSTILGIAAEKVNVIDDETVEFEVVTDAGAAAGDEYLLKIETPFRKIPDRYWFRVE